MKKSTKILLTGVVVANVAADVLSGQQQTDPPLTDYSYYMNDRVVVSGINDSTASVLGTVSDLTSLK